MTLRAPAITWAIGGLALAAVLGAVLPAFLRPLVVGAIAGGFGAQFARGLDPEGELRFARALPTMAGYGAAVGLFAALGALIREDGQA